MLATNANVEPIPITAWQQVQNHVRSHATTILARVESSDFQELDSTAQFEVLESLLAKCVSEVVVVAQTSEQLSRHPCTACDDSGKASCRACGGIGGEQIVCRVCGGKGEVGCAECGEERE